MATPRIENLERRRLVAGISIEKLALEARGSSVTYWRWLKDSHPPSAFVLVTFEDALVTLVERKIVTLQELLKEPAHGPKSNERPPSGKEEAVGDKGVKAKVRPQGRGRRSPTAGAEG